MNLYLEIKLDRHFSPHEAPVRRVIGPFKSINRLSSIELETDLGLLAATEQILFYDRMCFEWKILAEHPQGECEPYDQKKAMPHAPPPHGQDMRTTLERLHDLVDRHLPAYSQHFAKALRTEENC